VNKAWKISYAVLPILLYVVPPHASAQQSSCAAFLKFGIYDQYNSASLRTQFRLFQQWFCDSKFKSASEARSSATSLGITIPDLATLNFGNSSDNKKFMEESQQFCSSTYDNSSMSADDRVAIRSISPVLMSVVRHCLDTQAGGLATWMETSADRKSLVIKARYRSYADETAKIDSFDITPPSVAKSCASKAAYKQLQPQQVLRNNVTRSLTCEVDPRETVTVTLNTNRPGDSSILLDRVETVIPGDKIVNGTFTVSAHGHSAAVGYLDTGLQLPVGSKISVTASGQACIGPGVCADANGTNAFAPHCAPMGFLCGVLVAKIGNSKPFFVGTSFNKTLTEAGVLKFAYMDSDFFNNSGELKVTVQAVIPANKPQFINLGAPVTLTAK